MAFLAIFYNIWDCGQVIFIDATSSPGNVFNLFSIFVPCNATLKAKKHLSMHLALSKTTSLKRCLTEQESLSKYLLAIEWILINRTTTLLNMN